jgi:FkbM family methyltransferase
MLRGTIDWVKRQVRGRDTWYWMGTHGIAVTRSGHKIFVPPGDLGVVPPIAVYGIWEPQVEAVLRRLVKPGDIVVEVGANVGYHTLVLAERVGRAGQVHSFEPHPRLLPLLRATLAFNGALGRRVTLHACAALDAPGRVGFAAAQEQVGSGHPQVLGLSAAYDEVYAERFEVEAVRIDDRLADVPSIDLLRMDAEGSEGLALHGAAALIARSPRLRIVTEWSPAMLAARTSPADLAAWLGGQGFRAWTIARSGRLEQVAIDALPGLPHGELVLSRQDLG